MKREFQSKNVADTREIGATIASRIQTPATFLLFGELGAGKTELTRGLASGLGIEDPNEVRSPTFTLINQYEGSRGTIYHVDLYRLDTESEVYSTGLDEILASGSIVIIEWAEKLPWTVDAPVTIHFNFEPGSSHRTITLDFGTDDQPGVARTSR